MNKNWLLNALGVVTLILSVIVGAYFLWSDFIPGALLATQFILVTLLAIIGLYSPIITQSIKAIFKPSVQLLSLVVIGAISSYLSTNTVSALIPEDPFILKNALLMSTLITTTFLWLLVINVLLLLLYLYAGYKVIFSKEDNVTSQKTLHHIAVFAGLGVGIAFGYKQFLSLAIENINFFGSRVIVHSQFDENIRCTNIPKGIQIASVSNNEVLEFIDNMDNTFDYKRHKCILVKDTSLDNWPK